MTFNEGKSSGYEVNKFKIFAAMKVTQTKF
jgi:hypothetical protein